MGRLPECASHPSSGGATFRRLPYRNYRYHVQRFYHTYSRCGGRGAILFNWAPTKETTQVSWSVARICVHWPHLHRYRFDRWGCYNYALAKITKHSINLTGKTAFCQGDSSKLTALGWWCHQLFVEYGWYLQLHNGEQRAENTGIITGHTNGMIDAFTFTVTGNGLPIVRFLGNPYFCKGDSTIITAKADSSTYLWNTGTKDSSVVVRDSGLYSVVATTVYGCVDSDSIYVKEYLLPIVTIVGSWFSAGGGQHFPGCWWGTLYHWLTLTRWLSGWKCSKRCVIA